MDESKRFYLFGYPISHSQAPTLHNECFKLSGLANWDYSLVEAQSLDEAKFDELVRKPDFGGCAVTMPFKLTAVSKIDKLTSDGQAIGSINTVFLEQSSDGKTVFVGTNTDFLGVRNALLHSILPSKDKVQPFLQDTQKRVFKPQESFSFIIGGGGTTRAAVYALKTLGIDTVFLLNRDASETAAVVAQFDKNSNIVPLNSVEEAKEKVDALTKSGQRLRIGVGAIPAIEPVTDSEKMVYSIAKYLFSVADAAKDSDDFLGRHFLEMAYKPRFTPMMQNAKDANWQPICGVEAMIEQGLAQQRIWQKRDSLEEAEDKVREFMLQRA